MCRFIPRSRCKRCCHRAREHVDPAWSRRIRHGGDSHPEMSSSSGSVGLARAHPLTKNPGYGAFPPDLVQLRSTLPVGALVLGCRFKLKTPISFRVQCPRRFWDDGTPKFCARVSCPPAEPCTIFFFFSFSIRQIFWFLIFWGYVGLQGSHISSEEKEKENMRNMLGKGALNTCAKFQGLISQKRRGQFGLVCGEVQKSRLGIVMTWF